MFNHTSKILGSFVVLLLGGLTAAYGQLASDVVLKFSMPTSFEVQGKSMAAGEYTISSVKLGTGTNMLLLQSRNTRSHTIFFTENATLNAPSDATKLVFDSVGDQNILANIWLSGNTEGVRIAPTRAEKELLTRRRPLSVTISGTIQ